MIRQKYSYSTIKTYVQKLVRFQQFNGNMPLHELDVKAANNYISYIARGGASESLINTVYSAIKLYYEKVEYAPLMELKYMKRPRKTHYLPTVLSRTEVDQILRCVNNLKHQCMLYTLYGAGLRLGELLRLQIKDIYWERSQIIIKASKGKKDRMVMLSGTLKMLLEKYFDQYQPRYWLFEGQGGDAPYSSSSIQRIVKSAAKKAGIQKRVTPHTLRHCFATHLMDGGVDSLYIQKLLGHRDIRTTLIYTHVTNRSLSQIKSPLDNLPNKFINQIKNEKSPGFDK